MLKDWLGGLLYERIQGSLEVEVNEVVFDSRKAAPGCVFVCMTGTRVDSHTFIPQVLKSGCRVLVVERPVTVPLDVTVLLVKQGREALAHLSAAALGTRQENC